MNRVAPRQVNYDNILPLAIESRSNRREFLPVNGQTFSNSNGATICRIDVNADSMLDATHSYLECVLTNRNETDANACLLPNPFCPSWVQRLRIESGGVVIEDINEYARLYAMLVLNQCPASYIKNNLSHMGLYDEPESSALRVGAAANIVTPPFSGAVSNAGAGAEGCPSITELLYFPSAQALVRGVNTGGVPGAGAGNQPTADGITAYNSNKFALFLNDTITQCFPLVSGFLNMDKYIPLVMMNAGFTIELTLADANRIGVNTIQDDGADFDDGTVSTWQITAVKYIAHLIDLDRSFYDTLRSVMESSGGVLQLAGQTYRHFVGDLPAPASTYTITLPARVKSVKSIFGTFIASDQMGAVDRYDTSVFQRGGVESFRFEIGSVRYPQTNVNCLTGEAQVELMKAFGKLGDYQHQLAYAGKHTENDEDDRSADTMADVLMSAFFVGYDFEAFQRNSLEAGINTADRSLPINFIVQKALTNENIRADFFVLTDAIYYINLDGTVSVSI